MKSFLIWIFCLIIGAAAGFGISLLFDMNLYLLLGIGLIAGSSMGITWNIHRERNVEFENITFDQESVNEEEPSSE